MNIGYIVGGITCLIAAIIILMICVTVKRRRTEFEATKKRGIAVVLGRIHSSMEHSSHYNLCVRILDIDDVSKYSCFTRDVDALTFKKGDVIEVEYADTQYKLKGVPIKEIYLVGMAAPELQERGKIEANATEDIPISKETERKIIKIGTLVATIFAVAVIVGLIIAFIKIH